MVIIFFYLFLFVLGCLIGSFINVLIDRGDNNEQVVKGRSYCDHCKNTLKVRDMVPVLSFILLKGKCRYCRHKLSFYYPIVEIATGIIFVISAYQISIFSSINTSLADGLVQIVYALLISSVLIYVFFADLKYGIIPLNGMVIGILVALAWNLLFPISEIKFLNYFLSAFISFLSFLAIHLITKGKGMGMGDVIYVFFMGLLLGFPKILIGFYIAFISGALVSIVLILLKKKKMKGGIIPFGPFLVTGTYISLLWGDRITNIIMDYLLR